MCYTYIEEKSVLHVLTEGAMNVFSVLKLFGGLGLFLYGMNVMGGALARTAGGRLEKILEKFTNNPIKGVILGAIVTAFIQSSSATTVMTVGFVNSGIMKFSQAIGIIMGSNVGTTVTAWILSLAGLEGNNFFVMMLQPKNFTLIFAVIGAVLCVFPKFEKKANIGYILMGFTVLIYGMDFMSSAVSPLRSDPNFQNLLVMFTNPIAGVLLGTIVTAIVQSSSASVGILQALSVTGAVTYSSAIPIILGQNIGTCVTAMLSSIGTKREAKRVAFVHLYFNVIGTIIFLTLCYLIQQLIGFPFWNDTVNALDIAIIHSIFNIFCTLLFLPFTKLLAKLATLTVKDAADSDEIIPGVSLDPRFLSSPAFAIEQCKNTVATLSKRVAEDVAFAADAILNYDANKLEQIEQLEKDVNRVADRLNAYVVQVTRRPLTMQESRYISKLLHSVRNLERIADSAKKYLTVTSNMDENSIKLTDAAKEELERILNAIIELVNGTTKACAEDNARIGEDVFPLTEVAYVMCNTYRAAHIERVKAGMCSTEAGFYFDEILLQCEQITDRCAAIIAQVIALTDDEYRSQEYIESLHMETNERYRERYENYRGKYLAVQ